MEFVLKKEKGSAKTSISHKELGKVLDIPNLIKNLNLLTDKVNELERIKTDNFKVLTGKIELECVKHGDLINISSAASIEKNKDIKIGSIYFNIKKGLRIKLKEGWRNFKDI